jgi:S1-C subfamily serine protease
MLAGGVWHARFLGTGIVIGRGGAVAPGTGVNEGSSNAIIRAVKEVGPSVMNVDTDFGKADNTDFLPTPGEQPREGKGAGTGFIIDSKRGLMLTNAHVVAGAKEIQVTTSSGRKIKAACWATTVKPTSLWFRSTIKSCRKRSWRRSKPRKVWISVSGQSPSEIRSSRKTP